MSKIENTFLNSIIRERLPIFVYLVNGVRLEGYLLAYDANTLVIVANLENSNPLLVYRNVIATIQQVPVTARNRFRKTNSMLSQPKEVSTATLTELS